MIYFISSKFMNLSMNWEKNIFYWKKSNFEPTGNSEPTTEYLALGKPLATFPNWNSFFFFFFYVWIHKDWVFSLQWMFHNSDRSDKLFSHICFTYSSIHTFSWVLQQKLVSAKKCYHLTEFIIFMKVRIVCKIQILHHFTKCVS